MEVLPPAGHGLVGHGFQPVATIEEHPLPAPTKMVPGRQPGMRLAEHDDVIFFPGAAGLDGFPIGRRQFQQIMKVAMPDAMRHVRAPEFINLVAQFAQGPVRPMHRPGGPGIRIGRIVGADEKLHARPLRRMRHSLKRAFHASGSHATAARKYSAAAAGSDASSRQPTW